MPKTKETKDLEEALRQDMYMKRLYGCEEVTIGFPRQGLGNEVVDFLTMDSKGIFKCYEIKVSLSDLHSNAKKSWYGHYNYLVVSDELMRTIDDWKDEIPADVGIVYGNWLQSAKKAKKRMITDETVQMLKDSLIRSLSFKLKKNINAQSLQYLSSLESENRKQKERIRVLNNQIIRISQEKQMREK